ncbi:MAG: RNA polymerase sigma-70 factor [Bacteroidota bacterium]
MSRLSDQQLLRHLANGKTEVLKHYFDLHYSELCAYALKYVRLPEVSEEIVQELFINIWERRNELNVRGSMSSYLFTAARYRCFNYLKIQLPKDQATTESIDLTSEVPSDFDDDITNHELKKRLRAAIEDLPEKCRIIFLLAKEEGLTYKEIANELEVSTKTVENQMGIALKKLRLSLRPKPKDDIELRMLINVYKFLWM